MLRVSIRSFSFRDRGYPEDKSGHGGGFVFDCRFLENPGRGGAHQFDTGLDPIVAKQLAGDLVANRFLNDVLNMTVYAARSYVERGYTSLDINFGCVGGQHRSVYCADRFGRMLRRVFGEEVDITVEHLERDRWPRPDTT